ncbi:hypothetical protein ABK040_013465 [Willaertia magna]
MSTIEKHLTEIISSGQFAFLLPECESYEIEYLSLQKASASSFFYCCFLLANLINNDLNNARFLWKRMPNDAKKNDDVKGIWDIAKNLWNHNYEGAYKAINSLNPTNPQVKTLLDYFVQQLRQRTLELIARAYSNISTEDLLKYLGVNDQNTLNQLVAPFNWVFDNVNQLYIPDKKTIKAPEPKTGLEAIKSITQRTVFLELE